MYKSKLVFCTQKVNKEMVRRENRRGVEHVIIQSFTLPPNIVMNGGLYPESEVDKSFQSLNRTPVTVEHPELDGSYVSANDPEVDYDYRIGAFNENARKMDDGRISVDKVINVQKAMKSEKGKRLLDRINEVETSESPRAIHTSVGVFVDAEEIEEVKTSASGDEYRWIARNMIFDHDAILLDSIGAATPEQGTGIGINAEAVKVEHYIINSDEQAVIVDNEEIKKPESSKREECTMRDDIIAKLEGLGVTVNAEATDSELLASYDKALTANQEKVGDVELSKTVTEQAGKIEALEKTIAANKKAEMESKIASIKACSKFEGIGEGSLQAIYTNCREEFDSMYAESIPSHGAGSTTVVETGEADSFMINTKVDDLPE